MKRSRWKLAYIHSGLIKKRTAFSAKAINFTGFRGSTIPLIYIGRRGYIYNGRWSQTIVFESDTLGHKIGEYSITKKFDTHYAKSEKLSDELNLNNGSFN
jgi:ribosomal protein S19